ncbi:hypothetical protein IEQ34_009580 [Dendrobium chrysotoxum]|uniref:Uncharacterized protein n=1 Tax=Dendrobium chrysotoxum TaxID=161865 RepID=A0AAV7H389_DENCH|nr:hypothetical protein IEQ34_009580 [Dendrobium chrysotoxum]
MKTTRGERSSPKWALQNLSCLPLSRHRTNELLSLFVPLKAISATSMSSSPNAPPTWLPTPASGGTCPHASSTTATELCWLTPTLKKVKKTENESLIHISQRIGLLNLAIEILRILLRKRSVIRPFGLVPLFANSDPSWVVASKKMGGRFG